jgi:hypothetical protein
MVNLIIVFFWEIHQSRMLESFSIVFTACKSMVRSMMISIEAMHGCKHNDMRGTYVPWGTYIHGMYVCVDACETCALGNRIRKIHIFLSNPDQIQIREFLTNALVSSYLKKPCPSSRTCFGRFQFCFCFCFCFCFGHATQLFVTCSEFEMRSAFFTWPFLRADSEKPTKRKI